MYLASPFLLIAVFRGWFVSPSFPSISTLLQEQARTRPDSTAILAPGRLPLTYSALWEQAQRVAGSLRALGFASTTRVAVVMPNGPEMAVAFLGVAMCSTCVPLNPGSRESEFKFYLDDIGAQALIVGKDDPSPARACAREMGLKVIEIEALTSLAAGMFSIDAAAGDADQRSEWAASEDVALILHTSGTTARPKIVPLSHANLMTSAGNIARHLSLTPADRCLNVMPLFHIHGLVGALLSPLASGGSVVCAPGFNDRAFFDWIAEFEPSWYSAVPTIHQSVVAQGALYREKAPRHRFRFIRSSSSSLPPATMKALEALMDAPVIEAYSMTEAAHQMTSNALPPGSRLAGSVGMAAGIDVAIMDSAGQQLEAGATGEIVIRGASVIRAYENNPQANASSFTDGWFRTGDQGRLDADGRLFISGRIKEIVNRGGEKVSPREVDDAMLEHPAVAQVAAFAVPHPSLGEDLAAAVVLRPGTKVTESELRQFLFSKLSEFKVPSRILFIDAIPKGPTGKVQRTTLHQTLGAALVKPFVEATTDLEIGLATAWAKVLGVPTVGVTDNFFALGGNSLGVLKLCLEMEQTTGIKFQLGDVFRTPTIADLIAGSVSDSAQSASIVIPLQPNGAGIPVFCLYGINLYKAFAESLGEDQPVYGVFVREEQAIVSQVMAGDAPSISIQRLVDAYDKAISRFRPHGPYRLAGFSFGGIISMALAAKLRARGEEVEQVMLLDTVLAQGQSKNWSKWLAYRVDRLLKGETTATLKRRLSRYLSKSGAADSAVVGHTVSRSGEDIAAKQIAAFRRAAKKWEPNSEAIDFQVVLFRALDRSRWAPYVDLKDDYGWQRYLGSRLAIVDVPGVHMKIMELPNVVELGSKARQFLRTAAAPVPG